MLFLSSLTSVCEWVLCYCVTELLCSNTVCWSGVLAPVLLLRYWQSSHQPPDGYWTLACHWQATPAPAPPAPLLSQYIYSLHYSHHELNKNRARSIMTSSISFVSQIIHIWSRVMFCWSKFCPSQLVKGNIKHGVTGSRGLSASRSLSQEICGLNSNDRVEGGGCILIYNWSYTFMIVQHWDSRGLGIKEIFHLKSSSSKLCWLDLSSQHQVSLHELLITNSN